MSIQVERSTATGALRTIERGLDAVKLFLNGFFLGVLFIRFSFSSRIDYANPFFTVICYFLFVRNAATDSTAHLPAGLPQATISSRLIFSLFSNVGNDLVSFPGRRYHSPLPECLSLFHISEPAFDMHTTSLICRIFACSPLWCSTYMRLFGIRFSFQKWLGHAVAVLIASTCILFSMKESYAQGGWLPVGWFSSAAILPDEMFPLNEKDGPWLVLATTFRGDGARDDARQLAQELRKKHRLTAYTHEKAFDYTGAQEGLGLNPDGSRKKMRYVNNEQILEVAVLVGDFASFDDSRGQKMLTTIKTLQPDSLSAESGRSQAFSDLRRMVGAGKNKNTKGPMHLAFITPNPLLPKEFFSRPQLDDLVLEINSDVKHSLLDCPGRYSVRVAVFAGATMFEQQSDHASEKKKSDKMESLLVDAAEKAHRLTESLRRQGWHAWEFHDRESSIVCVGNFQQIMIPASDGSTIVDPEITRIVTKLGADPQKMAAGVILPRSVDGIMLEIQPKTIDVPQRPTVSR